MRLSGQHWGGDVDLSGNAYVRIRMTHRKTAKVLRSLKRAIVSQWRAFGGGASLGFTNVCTGYMERPNKSRLVQSCEVVGGL